MEIITHRGYWKNGEEKNKIVAFKRSFSLNLGTETDFRDYNEQIVISHDIANKECITARQFFQIFSEHNPTLTLALNVKADGLQKKLVALIQEFKIENYFVFDMSIPDTIGYMDSRMKFYSRQSEYEPQPAFYEQCDGIWLDAFIDIWYDAELIRQHIGNNKSVALVSPELHKRSPYKMWEYLKQNNLDTSERIILCTDVPEEACVFFNK